jgi:hypothetical protein
MKRSGAVAETTLWDLAAIVLEEAEKVCGDERGAAVLARYVLILVIEGYAKNAEIAWPAPCAVARAGTRRQRGGRDRRTISG